jgi:hypothetical protein
MRLGRLGLRAIRPVNRDVETRLVKLLFYIHLARSSQWHQVGAQPTYLFRRQTLLGDIDGRARQVRRCVVAIGRCRVLIHQSQTPLIRYRPHRRVYLKRTMKPPIMHPGQVGKKLCRPRSAVAPVRWQPGVHPQGSGGRNRNQLLRAAQIEQIGIVLNALQAVFAGSRILPEQRIVGASQRWRKNKPPSGNRVDQRSRHRLGGMEVKRLSPGAIQSRKALSPRSRRLRPFPPAPHLHRSGMRSRGAPVHHAGAGRRGCRSESEERRCNQGDTQDASHNGGRRDPELSQITRHSLTPDSAEDGSSGEALQRAAPRQDSTDQ